ncbi:NAD(P)H-dependent oxidoreductase [Olivibacter sp. SDN3]|uniref:NAD(P)H-dependent oxidoreductase n=1 Tax=Olivibacter sp. SDN3 TaxID=2764720 RepID=UPI0016516280|nr:NAD(P)H-dependent oxidoreductase [Olivibacter sp. SDN3]QNL51768.1 NAD(P)H-dependent oxidoreductase [Olivibacter sp. SDN3]
MPTTKIAVIYYSSTGTNYKLAKWAADAADEAGNDVKLLKIKETAPDDAIDSNPDWKKHIDQTKDVPEVSLDDLEWADGLIFAFPTRYGGTPSQVQQFLDTTGGLWSKGKLANKAVSAMTSAVNTHGGQETTLLSFYISVMHWGSIIAAPGYTAKVLFKAGGNPYGVSVNAEAAITGDTELAVKHQAKRTADIAGALKGLAG